MGDLISRKWLMEVVEEGWIKFDTQEDYNRIIHLVRDIAPSAQPEQKCETCRYRNLEWSEEPCDSCTMGGKDCHYKPERKKGEWEVIDETEPRRYGCSECKCLSWHMENYCPHCGADMRGEEE